MNARNTRDRSNATSKGNNMNNNASSNGVHMNGYDHRRERTSSPGGGDTRSQSPADQIASFHSDDADSATSNPIADQIASLHVGSPSSKSSALSSRGDSPAYMNDSPTASPVGSPSGGPTDTDSDMQLALRSAPTTLDLRRIEASPPGADSLPASTAVSPASPTQPAATYPASPSVSASMHNSSTFNKHRNSNSNSRQQKSRSPLQRPLSHSQVDVNLNTGTSSKPQPSPATLRRLRKETSPSFISSAVSPLASAHGTISPIATSPVSPVAPTSSSPHSSVSGEGEPHIDEVAHQPGAAKPMNRYDGGIFCSVLRVQK